MNLTTISLNFMNYNSKQYKRVLLAYQFPHSALYLNYLSIFGSSNCHKSHTILALKKGKNYELLTITNKNQS